MGCHGGQQNGRLKCFCYLIPLNPGVVPCPLQDVEEVMQQDGGQMTSFLKSRIRTYFAEHWTPETSEARGRVGGGGLSLCAPICLLSRVYPFVTEAVEPRHK